MLVTKYFGAHFYTKYLCVKICFYCNKTYNREKNIPQLQYPPNAGYPRLSVDS